MAFRRSTVRARSAPPTSSVDRALPGTWCALPSVVERTAKRDRAARLSRELRTETGGDLRRRRSIAGLSLVASASMGFIALYQLGIIRHLPDPPLPMMDADAVDASPEAYEKLGTPDAVLGLGSYAATMALAAMGGSRRAREAPWIPLALAAKIAFDAANAAKLSVDQWTRHRAFCFWCLIAAAATFATVPLIVPEAMADARAPPRRA